MNARRRALRRGKRELADHDRAVNRRRELQQLAARIGSRAQLDAALEGDPHRAVIVEALRPYLAPGIL